MTAPARADQAAGLASPDVFPPTRDAALARVAAIRPADYARSRNALDGAVTRLSPYLTHGVVTLPEVLAAVSARHRLDPQHKLVFEFGWREYFRHVWQHRGDGILASLHAGPLPDAAYAAELPDDVREARTGLPVIDQAVRTLYATGYLHNHARMWLASYLVHLRKTHWRTGADWMVGYLLDGDLASNHLSWQWVAGTASRKPYLFNADNVARHAPRDWHCAGSALDTGYEALDMLAHSAQRLAAPGAPARFGVEPPAVSSEPPSGRAPVPGEVAGHDVWLVHPWALGDPPADLPAGTRCIGWWPSEHHAAWPWSAARWAFVGRRLEALAPVVWQGPRDAVAAALAGARSVQTIADPHVAPWLPAGIVQRPAPMLFAEVDDECRSFSAWWGRVTRKAGRGTAADAPTPGG